jgi:ribosomal protein S18 acetylase RimI-like enzyme
MKIDVFQERYPQQVEAEVVLLFMDAFSAPPRYEEWDEASARDAIRKDYDPDAIFIAVSSEDHLVGFCHGLPIPKSVIASDIATYAEESDGFYLSNIAVDQTVRGQGLGALLVNAFLEEVAKKYAVCVARTREDALPVRNLFSKSGFTEKGRYEATVGGSFARRMFYVKRFQLL